jgi:SAM-dependent methyltransferase/uncharacterized protein YbaR (Trm112 family)
MDRALLDILACPYSCGPLELDAFELHGDEVEFGVLRGEAGEFPVVAGIPIMELGQSRLIALLRARRFADAIACATMSSPRVGRWAHITRRLQRAQLGGRWKEWLDRSRAMGWLYGMADPLASPDGARPSVPRLFETAYHRHHLRLPGSLDYSVYRLGSPTYLVALAFVHAMGRPRGLVLDVGCGAGQMTWAIQHQAAPRQTVGVDRSYFALRVARTRIAPKGWFVCGSAATLPFRDAAFDIAFSSDAFFHFPDKWASLREIERVLSPSGMLMLTGLRNKRVERVPMGCPLTPCGYRRLVSHLPHRVIPDWLTIERYLQGVGVPAGTQVDEAALDRSFAVSIWATKGTAAFADVGRFAQWPHAHGALAVNPLYGVARSSPAGTVYVRRFPPDLFAHVNPDVPSYLPELFVLSSAQRTAMEHHRRAELEDLIGRCAIVGFPEGYHGQPPHGRDP